jgi:hypothetical protein
MSDTVKGALIFVALLALLLLCKWAAKQAWSKWPDR